MILAMDSKTYIKRFVEHESDETILEASYILASNHIKIGMEGREYAMSMFYPTIESIARSVDTKTNYKPDGGSEYVKEYYNQLDRNINILAQMIKTSILYKLNVIIMCTKKEDSLMNILDLIIYYVYENFGYEIGRYKKDSSISDFESLNKDSELDIVEVCDMILKDFKKKRKSSNGGNNRVQYQEMSKKKLKKKLKKVGIDTAGMSHSEMVKYALSFL